MERQTDETMTRQWSQITTPTNKDWATRTEQKQKPVVNSDVPEGSVDHVPLVVQSA